MEIKKENLMVFANDDEFTNFAIEGEPTFARDEMTGLLWHDYDYTPEYKKAISENKAFLIMDKTSSVCKRGCVCRGLVNKPVENVYYYDN